ncbi:MAG: hypothetical protein MJZ27_10075 [Bacteroidales bacterium]|nr:hypothetical protein [Bacteroidales bacterium]
MNSVVERYNGYVGISGAWLSKTIGINVYVHAQQRGHILMLRRGGNGRTALVDWQSMGMKMKQRVMEALGCDPMEVDKKSLLKQILEDREQRLMNMDAYDYYSKVKDVSGHYLKEEKVREMWNGAKIMGAIGELLEVKRKASVMRKTRMSEKREFEVLAKEIGELGITHSLPESPDRLRKKFRDWELHGYESLVHKAVGKEGNRKGKIGIEVESVVAMLVSDGRKMNDEQVSKAMKSMGIEIDRRRIQEIRKKHENSVMLTREGLRKTSNILPMQVDRERPDMPLKMVSLDGWDAELYYQTDKSHFNRLSIVIVCDMMNNYPLGYAIGDRENASLIQEAMRNAVRHVRELFGEYYQIWQVQSDHYAIKAMTPYYEAVSRYFTPARVGNAKSKPIERYFAYLESEYLWVFENNSGHNITAKNKANDEWLNANKHAFPDRAGCVAQLEKVIEIERSRKIKEMRAAWEKGSEEMKKPLNMERYLRVYGEQTRGNMLTPNGLKVIREGKEYKFDCWDIEMREHRGERWTIHYDIADMNQALAVSEDGTLRYMIERKKKVPMALVDYTEQDYRHLQEYKDYNSRLVSSLQDRNIEMKQIAEGFISRQMLEGDLSGRLLTDAMGQHKDRKAEERKKKLAEIVEDTEYEEVSSAEKREVKRKAHEIWDRC